MSKLFNVSQSPKIRRNKFDLSFDSKVSLNMGELVPILCKPVLPGDEFRINTETLVRMQPLVAPLMHRVNVDVHYFYVPNRLVWNEWEKFITGGEAGTDAPVVPYYSFTQASIGGLSDYLGLPNAAVTGSGTKISMLAHRAYQLIYNEYYRDQNLEPKVSFGLGSGNVGSDYSNLTPIRTRAWEKDYFTSALPWTQRGAPVELPVGGLVDVQLSSTINPAGVRLVGNTAATGSLSADGGDLEVGGTGAVIDPNGSLNVDLGAADAPTVESFRKAIKLQQFLELAARVGSRYTEQLLGFFGVKSDDSRLQRPEFLGGGRTPMLISEIPQNSASGTTPQGNLAGHGISVGNTNSMKKYFKEHGYLFAIMSVLPKTGYQQGIPKHFLYNDRFDFPWPQFAQLGEQPIEQGEIYATYNEANDRDTIFGYQSRYADHKSYSNEVHGDFKSNLTQWHMSRIFTSNPALNSAFVKADPTHRVFAVTDTQYDKILVNIYHNIQAKRPLPFFNNPSLL